MVVVGLEPVVRFMERCGMATGTRNIALKRWGGSLPQRDPMELTRELYSAENDGKEEPSGSQDMIGLIYPGICRLDYDVNTEGGFFPSHIETCRDPVIARWVESVFYLIPVNQRPDGYNPLGIKNLDSDWIQRLGQTGKDCYDAILKRDIQALGASMTKCMLCWETILPHTVQHPTITINIRQILDWYQSRYPGAMYSGCGGGYLLIVSDDPVPGAFQVKVRIS
jgi:hypothetical protein